MQFLSCLLAITCTYKTKCAEQSILIVCSWAIHIFLPVPSKFIKKLEMRLTSHVLKVACFNLIAILWDRGWKFLWRNRNWLKWCYLTLFLWLRSLFSSLSQSKFSSVFTFFLQSKSLKASMFDIIFILLLLWLPLEKLWGVESRCRDVRFIWVLTALFCVLITFYLCFGCIFCAFGLKFCGYIKYIK